MISLLSMETDGLHSNLLNLLKTVNIAQENWKKKFKSLNNPCCFWRKKNGSIVCVGNWAQALHFIEQQISTCTVVATSLPSSLSPDQSVLHPILSLAYPRGKKCPLLVVFKSNQGPNWVFFDLSNLPVSETLQKSASPQEGTIAVLKSLTGSLHYVLSLPFLFFGGGKMEIHVWWYRSWFLELLCATTGCPPNLCLAGNRWWGWIFLSPLSVVESLSHTKSHDVEKGWDWHVGEARQRNRMFWALLGCSLLFRWLS